MINYVTPFAGDWRGLKVACRFQAWAGGKQLATADDSAPVYEIPDGTSDMIIAATPTAVPPQVPRHWEKTVFLSIGSAGAIIANAGSTAFVRLASTRKAGGAQYTLANIQVSRLKDVTTDVLGLLKKPPARRLGQDVDEVKNHENQYGIGNWPPKNWDLPGVPNAHFLDLAAPVKSGALNLVQGLSAIDAVSIVLRLAGSDVPQLFAVTWPKTIERKPGAAPTPFFLFIRQSNKGNHYDEIGLFVGGELDTQPYPDNFDYADEGLFANLHYGHDPLKEPWLKGVPYQAAKAGAKVVTVVPCNKFGEEFGILAKTEETEKILKEIQAFMFWKADVQDPPKSIGNTAIAAFSSGTFHLDNWLRDQANLDGNFLKNVVKAVYFLDPRSDYVNRFIEGALNWAGSPDRDKRIRLYMRYPSPAHQKLLGTSPSAPYVRNAGKTRTASVVTDADWTKAHNKYSGETAISMVDWTYSHHAICAMMLTHALAQDFS